MQADMNAKDYFVCFELFYRTAKDLPDDLRIKYYDSLMEYGLYWTIPEDVVIKSLLTPAMYSIEKTNEKRKQKSEYMKGNSNAVKTYEKGIKQRNSEQDRTEQNKTYENKKIRKIVNNTFLNKIQMRLWNKYGYLNEKSELDYKSENMSLLVNVGLEISHLLVQM